MLVSQEEFVQEYLILMFALSISIANADDATVPSFTSTPFLQRSSQAHQRRSLPSD